MHCVATVVTVSAWSSSGCGSVAAVAWPITFAAVAAGTSPSCTETETRVA